MTFQKAKEEYKWKQWKAKEEKVLREFGMSEEKIIHLRELDWEDFNAERRFWEHYSSDQEKLYMQREVENMDLLNSEQLLDCIENRQMWEILKNTDPKTIEMILMKIWGFSVKEISEYLNLPEKTIYTRINRLKRKIQTVLLPYFVMLTTLQLILQEKTQLM